MTTFASSELILRENGSVYHLALLPEQLAPTVITVGDPERVAKVSCHFDRIDHKVATREFHTHTGELNGKRLSVISTGIGTDNIDIVFNELDALVNIDLKKRVALEPAQQKVLDIVRIGTSGALQADLAVDSFVCSSFGLGLDGLLPHYADCDAMQENDLLDQFLDQFLSKPSGRPYLFRASQSLQQLLASDMFAGITATCPGFYGPQGRQLRLAAAEPDLLEKLAACKLSDAGHSCRISNFEMETAGIYGLGKLLGHRCLSLNAILANRADGSFSNDPGKTVDRLIVQTLERLTAR